MMSTNPPNIPSNPNKASAMKWLGKFSGACIVLFLGLSNYTIIYNTDKESRLSQIASFVAPYVFYTACASLSIWGLLFIYQQRGDADFINFLKNVLKKSVLYILLPSIAIAIVVFAFAISGGQLDLSKTSFW